MDSRSTVLKRNKAIATGLMIGAAILFVVARSQKGHGAWEWLAAFAEAAMVGALADWFAVVALFRHPLGVPIPHTAIIKNKKDAIAGNLATFIRDKFLDPATLTSKLKAYNPAERLTAYLISANNSEVLAQGLTRVLSDSLDFLDDERVQKIVHAALNDRIEKFDLSSSAGVLLDTLRSDNRHQAVLDEILRRCEAWISTPEAQTKLAAAIESLVKKEYPLLSAFIPNRDQFSQGAGEKIVKRVNEYLQDVNADPEHNLRKSFDAAVTDFVNRLKTDQILRTRIETIKLEALHNALLAEYARNLAADLKDWICNDLKLPQSTIKARIAGAISGLGTTMANSRELKDSLNEHLERLVNNYGDALRTAVAKHISETVQEWKTEEYVSEIELSIGSDLQFIRMNGTLVGGAIGLLLHAISLLLN